MAKTLMVTPFAPYRDGIATYAAQELRARRAEGEAIDLVSPLPSAANLHLPLGGVRGAVMLVNLARSYQRVVIQYAPEILFGGCRTAGQRMSVWSALIALARLTPLELRIHEIEYQPLNDNPAERRLVQLLFRLTDQVTVHTEPERELLRPLLGSVVDRIQVIDHGRNFVTNVVGTPDEAKLELQLPADEFVFLSIGFIQRHKGFDRSVEAFALARLAHARLHIVGSGRVDHPEIGTYVGELADMCAATDRVELHNRFVSDDQFDLWLQAADAVVLPYREIWSSSVVERARLFDKPVIVSDLEQLRHQVGDVGYACPDVGQMAVAMEKVWSTSPFARLVTSESGADRRVTEQTVSRQDVWQVDDEQPDRSSIQAQITRRAQGGSTTPVAVVEAADTTRFSGSPGWASAESADRMPSRRIATLGALDRPEPVSARPGVAPVKQAVQRATGWQLDPMYQRIRDLQQATLDAVVEMESRIAVLAAEDAVEGSARQPSEMQSADNQGDDHSV